MPLKFAKPTKLERLDAKDQRTSARTSLDNQERKKCHKRSGGRCEVVVAEFKPEQSAIVYQRCKRKASVNHHLLGGRGRRNVGVSILAEHRLDICVRCNAEIHADGVLTVVPDAPLMADQVKYWRVR